MAKKRKFLFGLDRQNVQFLFKTGCVNQEIQKASINRGHTPPFPNCEDYGCAKPPLQAVGWIDLDKSALCPRPRTRVFAGAEGVIFIFPMP